MWPSVNLDIPSLTCNITLLQIQLSDSFCKSQWAHVFNSLTKRPRTANTGSRPRTPVTICQAGEDLISRQYTWRRGLSKADWLISSETLIFRDKAVHSLQYRKDLFHMSAQWPASGWGQTIAQGLLTASREKAKGMGSNVPVFLNFL